MNHRPPYPAPEVPRLKHGGHAPAPARPKRKCAPCASDTDPGAGATWHLYIIRTVGGALYAGIATDVGRRYREHATGGPRAAGFLRANPPGEIVFKRRIGSRSLALKVECRVKRLRKREKEAIVLAGRLHFDRDTGEIRR